MKRSLLAAFILLISVWSHAKEGMWIPSLIKNLAESDMKEMGMKISAEDIYSFNKSSLKDAVVHFGGGCTAEMISEQGLLLTNHHCGYSQIQSHSSVENDYLTNGFWAMDRSQEKKNPGLTATFIIKIEDVTESVLDGVTPGMDESERQKLITSNIKKVGDAAIEGSGYKYIIRPFYFGNEYYMFLTETFKDVRLVGAPPSSIGKFGFDTDNWVWPRHTGDFSIFRIYADKDNKPAEISDENVPYQPRYSFPINMDGVKKGDFTMIYGFPGRTSEYLTSHAVEYVINKQNPNRIKMRDISLDIIGASMASSDKIRIQYAAKQSRISNAWKKWKGQNMGLIRNNAIDEKKKLEERFNANANMAVLKHGSTYTSIVENLGKAYFEIEPYQFTRDMFIEVWYYGPEILRYAMSFDKLNPEKLKEGEWEKKVQELRASAGRYFKNYHKETDQKLFEALLRQYFSVIDSKFKGEAYENIELKYAGDFSKYASDVFENSVFTSKEDVNAMLDKYKGEKSFAKLRKDPAFALASSMLNGYLKDVKPEYNRMSAELDLMKRTYMKGLMTLLPNDMRYYPDANSTLRVAYGKVRGYDARDAVVYDHFTTVDGILAKKDNSTKEFTVPDKLVELIENKDFGQYADEDGSMHVCFIASNHTTGGNSGSPALNGNGELIGLNFDRTWESTMSDIMFDPEICRNIMVDIRYVLFIVDKYAGAGHLVEEMKLVKK